MCQEAWSPNHWTTREFPYFIKYFLPQFHQQPSLVLDPPTLSLSHMLAIIRDCLASESWNSAQWTCRPAQVPPTFLSGSQSVGPLKCHWLPLNRHFHSQDRSDRGKFQQVGWKGPGLSQEGCAHTPGAESGFRAQSTARLLPARGARSWRERFRGKSQCWELSGPAILSRPQENALVPEKSEGKSAILK